MFTGIIAAAAKVIAVDSPGAGESSLAVENPFDGVTAGESIAVNGVCLTVAGGTAPRGTPLRFFASRETCARSNLGALSAGEIVNLERALLPSDRLSGHIVQGHVDGVARIAGIRKSGGAWELTVRLPDTLLPYVIPKGSIALDGVSLTINSVLDSDISIMIIPHTWEHTHFPTKKIGQDLNVEVDVVAKYVERILRKGSNAHDAHDS